MCHSVDIKVLRPSARAAAAFLARCSNFKQLKNSVLVERTSRVRLAVACLGRRYVNWDVDWSDK